MIYTDNIFALPLLLLAGSLDLFLFMAGLRLVLGRIEATRNSRLCMALSELVDPIIHAVHRAMSNLVGQPIRPWSLWLIVIGTALVIRHCLMRLIIAIA